MGRITVAVIVSLWVIPVSIIVNRIVLDPYMDEIFHIPQAQEYCRGNFRSWDPMITTPPGLYHLSLAYVASLFPGMYCLKAVSSFSHLCSTAILRSVNGVLAVICSMLMYEIIIHLRPALDKSKATLYAVVLALYPLHWFFTFLYYTDVASLTVVLAMYLACLKKNYLFSALDWEFGALSVVLRQTNIIWMLFVVCTGVIDITMAHHQDNMRLDDFHESSRNSALPTPNRSITGESKLRKRRFSTGVRTDNHSTSSRSVSSTAHMSGLVEEFRTLLLTSWHLKWKLLSSFLPFFLVLAAFAAFVHWNGSVVLGAKEAHAVSPHFAQIMYFSVVASLAMAPWHFSLGQVADILWSFWRNRPLSFFLGFIALTGGLLSVHFFSIAHPYLLADNRHYPFYLWRKVINAHWSMKYLLVPLYVYSWFSIFSILGKAQRKIWVLAYFLASAAALIPAPLIEFRYYTIPFFLLVLHSHTDDARSWLFMGVMYITVNAFTMMMFLYRPFHWEHKSGIQRFIW